MLRMILLLGLAGLCSALTGCGTHVNAFNETAAKEGDAVTEGTLFSVKYDLGDGKVGGFTRLNTAQAVPGGNGSWNVDARGKLTTRFLIVTYPPEKQLGPLVIPVERLLEVQFGTGGIEKIEHGGHADGHDHH
jgi:hypothetical protein